jgi:osmotically-inducible protein OsmY
VAIVAGAVYLWKTRSPGSSTLGTSARQLGSEARGLGAQAREKLGEVGAELQDAKVKASVKTALELDRNLHPYSIEVDSERGVVTLRGRVDGRELRERAGTVAAGVPDVARVENEIEATPGSPPEAADAGRTLGENLDDHALEMQVKLALSLRRELKGSDLTVKAYRRQVTLAGEVASPAQRDLALQTARDTGSVGTVIDQIQVRGTGKAAGREGRS